MATIHESAIVPDFFFGRTAISIHPVTPYKSIESIEIFKIVVLNENNLTFPFFFSYKKLIITISSDAINFVKSFKNEILRIGELKYPENLFVTGVAVCIFHKIIFPVPYPANKYSGEVLLWNVSIHVTLPLSILLSPIQLYLDYYLYTCN